MYLIMTVIASFDTVNITHVLN